MELAPLGGETGAHVAISSESSFCQERWRFTHTLSKLAREKERKSADTSGRGAGHC